MASRWSNQVMGCGRVLGRNLRVVINGSALAPSGTWVWFILVGKGEAGYFAKMKRFATLILKVRIENVFRNGIFLKKII